MDPLISVIVPIYGIERYVGQCIESIINQSYGNLEIILVDDGGRDRCPEICDLYGRKDGRIKVIHKSNGGLVSARKAGLMESSGSYVSYVDGDDWLGAGFIKNLCDAAMGADADIVCAGYSRDLFERTERFCDSLPPGVYAGDEIGTLRANMISLGRFYRPGITTYVWNKLFRREVLTRAQMGVDDRISIGEDGAVTYPALFSCGRVVLTGNTEYHYRQREDSMLKQSNDYSCEARGLGHLYEYLSQWAGANPVLRSQVTDYVLSLAIIRSGGMAPKGYAVFEPPDDGRDIAIYSAGTFGQQLARRIAGSGQYRVAAWLDDDYWEYRRCGLDVDPVESIAGADYDQILIATLDAEIRSKAASRLLKLGVRRDRICGVKVSDDREGLLRQFLEVPFSAEEEGQASRGAGYD